MTKGASPAADASGPDPDAGAALGPPGRASLLVAYIRPVCALLERRRAGASTPRRVTPLFTSGSLDRKAMSMFRRNACAPGSIGSDETCSCGRRRKDAAQHTKAGLQAAT